MPVRSLGTISVTLSARVAPMIANMRAAQMSMMAFNASAIKVGATLTRLGRGLTMFATLPILGVGFLAVKAFGDFDKAMTESLAIMGDVSTAMRKEMAEAAIEMSEKTTFAAKELAEAYFFLASAGLDAEKSIRALPIVAKFAQAGTFDLSRATSLLAGSTSALGLKVQDATQNMINMTRVSDVLVKANRLADATTEQFATALTRAGGIMKAYGIDLEGGTAVLAAFAEVQRKAEVGGEAFARIIRLLIPGAVKYAAAYKKLGVRVFDAAGDLRNFADIIGDMEVAFKGMAARQKSAALTALGFQKRFQGAILPVIGMSKQIRRYEAELRKAGGTTEDVARKQLVAFWNQMKILRNIVVNAARSIAVLFEPQLRRLVTLAQNVAKWFKGLSDRTKRWMVAIAAVVAVIGPLLLIIGGLVSGLGGLVAFFALAGPAIIAFVGGLVAIGLVIAKIILIFGAFTLAVKLLIRQGGIFEEAYTSSMKSVGDVTESIVDDMKKSWGDLGDTIREKIKSMIEIVITGIFTIPKQFNKMIAMVKTGFDSLERFGRMLTNALTIIFGFWMENFSGLWEGLINTVIRGLNKIRKTQIEPLDFSETFKNLAKIAKIELAEDIKAIRSGEDYLENMEKAVKKNEKLEEIAKNSADKFKGVIDKIGISIDKVKEAFSTGARKVSDTAKDVAGAVVPEQYTITADKRFAGAFEKGTEAAYSAALKQNKVEFDIERNTKSTADSNEEISEGIKEMNRLLKEPSKIGAF